MHKNCILRENNPQHLDYLLSMLTESIEKDLFVEIDKLPEVLKKALYEREPFYVTNDEKQLLFNLTFI